MGSEQNKYCISCGMPLKNKSDYYQDKTYMEYCIHCAKLDGSMKSYDEMLESMIKFLNASHGLEEKEARVVAIEMFKR